MSLMQISRRSFLGGTSALLAGCATGHRSVSSTRAAVLPQPQLARVHVSADRVIRTITGLRPFRPSGFVVRGEKRGEKTIIHNYGHGGAGITLSWGTAQLAVEEGAKSEARDCAVLGCGVVGLSTARLFAAARLQSGDLREGDASADDIECRRRILGPRDIV